ncbi:MAG: cobalt-precorrin-5B (C(1))-methyltransferase CbiD [Lachnospiraceae bacterium]
MRYGFTTGSCAAAASKAAAYMLLSGRKKEEITIKTPKGIPYTTQILCLERTEQQVSCAVKKDGGDDPDVTTGTLIFSRVSIREKEHKKMAAGLEGTRVFIEGGEGIGRVTKPGLDQPIGSAAINHVPREMIEKEVLEVCDLFDYDGALNVTIFAPAGQKLAEHTFNPRLGIVGGISILGTSGIVEPMSNQALLETIRLELNQRRELGYSYVVVSPGNYGLEFMKQTYGYDLDRSVKCSNYIGETIDMAVEFGFQRMLLAGHIGKLIKVAGGIMNTHSREGDCRMELLTAFGARFGMEQDYSRKILDCVTTQEAVGLLKECGILENVMDYAMERICFYLNKRAKGQMSIDCIMYANEFGELAKSREVAEWFTLLAQEQAQ